VQQKAINRLGELERAVMDAVWLAADEGRPSVSVREVHDALSRSRTIAYTTAMTVMGRLTDAGLLVQERSGRAYRYAAAGTREELTAATMREQLRGMGGEDRRAAMLHFMADATPDELADLKAALAEVEARHGAVGRRPGGRS
jgi:predicted transcriptional regulator